MKFNHPKVRIIYNRFLLGNILGTMLRKTKEKLVGFGPCGYNKFQNVPLMSGGYLLRRGGRLFRLDFGHQGEGCQTGGGPSCHCGDHSASTPACRGRDGALGLRLLRVETLRVTAGRGDLGVAMATNRQPSMNHQTSHRVISV